MPDFEALSAAAQEVVAGQIGEGDPQETPKPQAEEQVGEAPVPETEKQEEPPEAPADPEEAELVPWLQGKQYIDGDGNVDVVKVAKQAKELESQFTKLATLRSLAEKLGGEDHVQAIVGDYTGFMQALASRPDLKQKFEAEIVAPLRGEQPRVPAQAAQPTKPSEDLNREILKKIQAGNVVEAIAEAIQHSALYQEIETVKSERAKERERAAKEAQEAAVRADWVEFIGKHPELVDDKGVIQDQELYNKLTEVKFGHNLPFKRAYAIAVDELGRKPTGAPPPKKVNLVRRANIAQPISSDSGDNYDSLIKGLRALRSAPSIAPRKKK